MTLEIAQDATYLENDRWSWSVWLEGPDELLDQVDTVAWQLHPTFPDPLRWTSDRASKFKLTTEGWGIFEIQATAYNEKGQPASLHPQMLDLEYPHGVPAEDRVIGQPAHRVFISASLRDAELVERLSSDLVERGYEVWNANTNVPAGSDWQTDIDRALTSADAVVAVIRGELSYAVESEMRLAAAESKPIVQLVVGDVDISSLDRLDTVVLQDESNLTDAVDTLVARLN